MPSELAPVQRCRLQGWKVLRLVMLLAANVLWLLVPAALPARGGEPVGHAYPAPMQVVRALAALGDRSTGTKGCDEAAAYVAGRFAQLGIEEVGSQKFAVPVLRHGSSTITLTKGSFTAALHPLRLNVISPQTIAPPGLEGPVVYVGRGELHHFNGREVEGAIVLMELDSGENWLHAADLGALALIYVDRAEASKNHFDDKQELSPIDFPRFWMPVERVRELFGVIETAAQDRVTPRARIVSETFWEQVTAENVYCLIPGTDPKLKEQIVVVEAFYDSTPMVFDRSPGADEACSLAALLDLARRFQESPPARSVVLVATAGHAQSLAGMRELIGSLKERTKDLRRVEKDLRNTINAARKTISILRSASLKDPVDAQTDRELLQGVSETIKTEVDRISRRLMALRLSQKDASEAAVITELADRRLLLRRFGWRSDLSDLTEEERRTLETLIPRAVEEHEAILCDAQLRSKLVKSAKAFRSLVQRGELVAVVSLHLSSHGDGVGAFNQGWLYPLKPEINRAAAYSSMDEVLLRAAAQTEQSLGLAGMYHDTLRPSRLRSWHSYFLDRPALGGEVSALAGYLGVSLVTVHDARPRWGTPHDLPESVDEENLHRQTALVWGLVDALSRSPELCAETLPRNGYSTVTGRAKFIRHGELFPDQPAPGTVILAFQGSAVYHSMVDAQGGFTLRGVADKKHVLHKVILEGYRFDPDTGSVVWTIDKKQTGKNAYRVKMERLAMETDLVMFACKQTTLFNLLEPRTLRYMTRLQLIDGRREAIPMRYWYSRIDTRRSIICSIYLEPGTRLKLTLSDTILRKKMILTRATEERSEGTGYLVDEWPFIHRTEYRVARDMWALLGPRITNLESKGIVSERIRELWKEGRTALEQADAALKERLYDRFAEASRKSWALASRVYDHVETTQRDVLFGVLFYIALFVPFAFCMERLLFSFADIHKRIIAFCALLLLLIAVIYKVHPAFELAYSPTVVILAFFIIGLSFMVTVIVFLRFEEEMVLLQRRAREMSAAEMSRWKAFTAAFLLGVSNLRRRRLRTGLTCATLIILTFTIMSFTSVKTMRQHHRLLYQPQAPYEGILLKNVNWNTLPPGALEIIANAFQGRGTAAPRVWLEGQDKTQASRVPVGREGRIHFAEGLVGLSASEPSVTGLDAIIVGGRWFTETETDVVLLPRRVAQSLGIDAEHPEGTVSLWGVPHRVVGVFSGKDLQERCDLDGEPVTPVIFPGEAASGITEVEMDALESGEDIEIFQSRYHHIPGDLTVIVPYRGLLAAGGSLKAVTVRLAEGQDVRTTARDLADRFGLSIFSGEKEGTFVYNAGDTLSYSGVPNVVVPMIISVFIVLNTMIGSVYERKREIGIYTSVGLAPSHVSFLFIAEAMAFAVLSVVLGYLLAQTTARLLAGTALWAGITVNYSSLAGVAAMVLVILVVLVSVIYPSRVAAQIAIPDVNRSWTLPEARENVLELTLPFLMKYREHHSIGGYLCNYFQGHQEVSHGLFCTAKLDFAFVCPMPSEQLEGQGACTEGSCCARECLHFGTRVWLAPFDLGIMQWVEVRFCPAKDEPGFLEISLRLTREVGEANAWKRINKAFLHQVRKQLLVWRSLDDKAHRHYEQVLLAAAGQAGVPGGDTAP